VLLKSGLNTSQALDQLKQELAGRPEVQALIDFIQTSERGIIK
jgi:acyl-[acyl carrier protein]--UDP-N-acetylglucosamine O-acyltransferase